MRCAPASRSRAAAAPCSSLAQPAGDYTIRLHRWAEHEHLDRVVRIEQDLAVIGQHLASREALDGVLERLALEGLVSQAHLPHQLLLVMTQQSPLNARDAALEHAEQKAVALVALGLGGALAVRLGLDPHHLPRDRGEDLA